MDRPFTAQTYIHTAVIAERECGYDGCENPPTATYSMVWLYTHEPRQVSYEVIWGCDEHVPALIARAEADLTDRDLVTGWLQDLAAAPYCLICSDEATHVAFIARDYGPNARRLEAANLCERHADEAPTRYV